LATARRVTTGGADGIGGMFAQTGADWMRRCGRFCARRAPPASGRLVRMWATVVGARELAGIPIPDLPRGA
jgi:hypothetical protein